MRRSSRALQTPALGSGEAGETKLHGLQSSGVWSEFQEVEMRRKGRRNVALWVLNFYKSLKSWVLRVPPRPAIGLMVFLLSPSASCGRGLRNIPLAFLEHRPFSLHK